MGILARKRPENQIKIFVSREQKPISNMLALKVEKLKCSVEGIVVVVATETVEWVRGSRNNLLYVRTKIIYYDVTSDVQLNIVQFL